MTLDDPKILEKIFLRPSLEEIYDLEWSPDSSFILAGALNAKVIKFNSLMYAFEFGCCRHATIVLSNLIHLVKSLRNADDFDIRIRRLKLSVS